tara:strand:+ start:8 stop:520 length:513 start_codon:yes stop_codon:yes gene_type:complete
MAGKLVQVATETVSGTSTNAVDLIGTTTDDVYMVALTNASTTLDGQIRTRVLVSSSADTSSEYDQASEALIASASFNNDSLTNQSNWRFMFTGNQTNETQSAIFYLYNFNNSSEYSFVTNEVSSWTGTPRLYGLQGGGVHTVAQSCNGIRFYAFSGNLSDGSKFTLYKVV